MDVEEVGDVLREDGGVVIGEVMYENEEEVVGVMEEGEYVGVEDVGSDEMRVCVVGS